MAAKKNNLGKWQHPKGGKSMASGAGKSIPGPGEAKVTYGKGTSASLTPKYANAATKKASVLPNAPVQNFFQKGSPVLKKKGKGY